METVLRRVFEVRLQPCQKSLPSPLPSITMAFLASPIHRSTASIATLANRVSKISTQINGYLTDNNHAHPDFTPQSPTVPETFQYQTLRNQLSDAALDLLRLVNGPKNTFRTLTFSHTDLAATQVALRRKFFHHIPNNAIGLSASALATATSMDVDRTSRILKMLATHRIFEEVDGKFRHTAASAFLKTSVFASMAEASLDDFFKATSEMDASIDAAPCERRNAFVTRFAETFYAYVERDAGRARRFSEAMRSWSESEFFSGREREGYGANCGV
jgi:hypothetical protein